MEMIDKETRKLEDLEWEYEISKKLKRDKGEMLIAYHKYRKQYRKVEKMQNEGQGVEGLRVESSN
jgi:hypothetical protein